MPDQGTGLQTFTAIATGISAVATAAATGVIAFQAWLTRKAVDAAEAHRQRADWPGPGVIRAGRLGQGGKRAGEEKQVQTAQQCRQRGQAERRPRA